MRVKRSLPIGPAKTCNESEAQAQAKAGINNSHGVAEESHITMIDVMNNTAAASKNDFVLITVLHRECPVSLNKGTVQRWCRTGLLKCRKIGGRYFADVADFRRMVEGNHV